MEQILRDIAAKIVAGKSSEATTDLISLADELKIAEEQKMEVVNENVRKAEEQGERSKFTACSGSASTGWEA